MKMVIGDVKAGRSFSAELPKEKESQLIGKKVGEKLDGGLVGLAGYTLVITGGSDNAGFPMRKDVAGSRHVKAVLSGKPGLRNAAKGFRKAKLVTGNTIAPLTHQINCRIETYGAQSLEELGKVKPKENKEKPVEKPAAAEAKPSEEKPAKAQPEPAKA